jgi:hypothetical protein
MTPPPPDLSHSPTDPCHRVAACPRESVPDPPALAMGPLHNDLPGHHNPLQKGGQAPTRTRDEGP